MKTLKEMNKEEVMSYAQEAMKFCQSKNLFLPGELEKLKAMGGPKLMSTAIARMELYQKAHPENK